MVSDAESNKTACRNAGIKKSVVSYKVICLQIIYGENSI